MENRVGFTATLLRVGKWALLAGAYSCLTLLDARGPFPHMPALPSSLDAVLSFAIAVLIAFRVNRAYERWWEARTLWGKLVNVSRNLAVKTRALLPDDSSQRQSMRNLIVAFSMGLRDYLRGEPELQNLPGFEHDPAAPAHPPAYVVRRLYERFEQWKKAAILSEEYFWILDRESREFLEVSGGCEKIKNTLMSVSWHRFTQQCITIYLIVLPWGLIDDFGLLTIPLTVVAAYFVIASEGIAQNVERPFGTDADQLDLDAIIAAIDLSVSEILLSSD